VRADCPGRQWVWCFERDRFEGLICADGIEDKSYPGSVVEVDVEGVVGGPLWTLVRVLKTGKEWK
jgi:hypothetical protein